MSPDQDGTWSGRLRTAQTARLATAMRAMMRILERRMILLAPGLHMSKPGTAGSRAFLGALAPPSIKSLKTLGISYSACASVGCRRPQSAHRRAERRHPLPRFLTQTAFVSLYAWSRFGPL